MRSFWLPLTLVLFSLCACTGKKTSTTPGKTPDKPVTEPVAEKNYTLSAPMDKTAIVEAFQKASGELDALVLAGTEVDLGDFLQKKGLDAKGACAAGGRLTTLRPEPVAEDGLEPTARGLIVGFVDTEEGTCARNLGYCALTVWREETGKYHLRAADIVLQVGRGALSVSGEYPLNATSWAMVVTDEETETCKTLAKPDTGGEAEGEDSENYEESGGTQPESRQEVILFHGGEFFSVFTDAWYSFTRSSRHTLERKVNLALYTVGPDVLAAPETWILASSVLEQKIITDYEESEYDAHEELGDQSTQQWICEKITAAGKREPLSPAEAKKLAATGQFSHLKCGQSQSTKDSTEEGASSFH